MTQTPFLFAIPFLPRSMAADWDQACAALANTLRSVLNQSDSDFSVAICCHDVPSLPADIRERINVVEATFAPPIERSRKMFSDGGRKVRQLAGLLADMGGGYFFRLDADDLVSRDLVAYARAEADPNGYLVETGYVLDAKTGILAPVPGAWKNTPFHQVCGSCAIRNLSASELPGGELYRRGEGLFAGVTQHKNCGVEAAAMGRPLRPIPFPAVVYVLNTGNNISYALLRDLTRQAELHGNIDRNAVGVSDELAKEFSLPLPR